MTPRKKSGGKEPQTANPDQPEYHEGDSLVHPSYGAGKVIEIKKQQIAGIERRYYNIELINERGTLMIPISQASEAGLRLAIKDPKKVMQVLVKDPETLDSDHRKRQAELTDKIRTGKITQVAGVLRDLSWREHVDGLTERDSKLKSEAQSLLAGELALHPDFDLASAEAYLAQSLEQAISAHIGHLQED